MTERFVLEAKEKRGQTVVKITDHTRKHVHYARLDEQGRIVYGKPERVPDKVKKELAPAFFRQLKRNALGIV